MRKLDDDTREQTLNTASDASFRVVLFLFGSRVSLRLDGRGAGKRKKKSETENGFLVSGGISFRESCVSSENMGRSTPLDGDSVK